MKACRTWNWPIPSRLACRRTTSTPCSSCSRACSPRPEGDAREQSCLRAGCRGHRRQVGVHARLNPLPRPRPRPIGAAVGRVSNGRRRRAESAAGTDSASASPPPPPAAKSAAPKPPPSSGPDQAANERSHNDALADAIRNPQLRKAAPSPGEAGAKPSHQDALLDAIRNPQLRSREQTDEIVKKIVEKDKAKVDAAKDKALTPEQKKLGGLHGG